MPPAASGADEAPQLVASLQSAANESMDRFALRIAPVAMEASMRLSGEVCGEFRREGDSLLLDLYSIRRLRHCSYRRLASYDYTSLTFHTHVVIGETDERRRKAKLMNPKFSAEDYAHPGYLASGRHVLFQNGRGTERRLHRSFVVTEPTRPDGYISAVPSRSQTVSDNTNARGEPDRSRINVNQEHEVRYWTKELGVSEERLRQAVDEVGTSADEVREFLAGR